MFTEGNTKEVAECNFKRDKVTEGFDRNSLVSFVGIPTEATECNLKFSRFVLFTFCLFITCLGGGTQTMPNDTKFQRYNLPTLSSEKIFFTGPTGNGT